MPSSRCWGAGPPLRGALHTYEQAVMGAGGRAWQKRCVPFDEKTNCLLGDCRKAYSRPKRCLRFDFCVLAVVCYTPYTPLVADSVPCFGFLSKYVLLL